MRKIIFTMIIILTLSTALFTGCSKNKELNNNRISIAGQFGLAYAPLEIMKANKILEKNLPDVTIEWKQLGNTSAIREAMLSGEVDIGFMAIPPFLLGWDKGMDWKIACGLSSNPVGLVTYKENIKSIKDFTEADRIAMPQPGSVQHILLSMACEKEFNDSHRLDYLLVTLSHPDGMNALFAKKEISAHFTSPPYLFKELGMPGMHMVLDGKEAMGSDFTFIIGAAGAKFHDSKNENYKAFIKSVKEAMEFINNNPEEASEILSKAYGMEKTEVIDYLKSEGVEYGISLKGVKKFSDFMKKNGYISKYYEKIEDIIWDDVKYED